ncbi:protein ROS1-like [Durio zibethinus]|uniref:Protein ROS1-like n=1 Tax=Durio zibethinus TaxID=66656 RepID=A0A6P6AQJ8_DURZI|nr:protein ROS1-like [Durio zibethinus]XP_022767172.1 protein ROS1-like [Durio zibethinus]XP_022767173.1 protein ROS1-like [Durio zibethinus]
MSKQGEEQFEFQHPLVPVNPFRPNLPKPPVIHAGRQGNEIFQTNCMGPERCSSGFTQESQTDRIIACSDSAGCREVNGGVNNLKGAFVGSKCIPDDSNGQGQFSLNLAEFSNVPFADLLALANAASAASTNAASEGINRHHPECSSAGLLPVHVNLSAQQNIWIDGNCTPRKHQKISPLQNPYDFDLPAGTMDALSHTSISDFAPITPEKATRVESKEDSEIENSYMENRPEKRDEQANELAGTRVDVNGLQCSIEIQKPVTESSLAAIPSKENNNPDNGGIHLADLEKTPQQKQRRRKHRPKVITEGKPRTRKPVTPKPSGSQENPTGKRKYVRKNRLNKDTSIPPGEANAENSTRKRKYVRRKGLNKDSMIPTHESGQGATPTDTLEHNKKSCRRALGFDTEGQERGESPACKPACNLNSTSGTENLWKGGSQSKSIMQLCSGIELAAENTKTGIAYELNQKLKEYLSLPEDQAPRTPLPTKNNPPCRRQNANSQKLNNRKDQCSAHDVLKKNGQSVGQSLLQSNAQLPARSPNDSNCSTSSVLKGGQASELKTNKSTATQQAYTSAVNSYGSHYNNLYVYQMIPGIQFSKNHRRKRTEKGQTSATSSASSSITAAKSLVPAEVCLLDSIEVSHPFSSTGVPAKLEEAGRNFSLNKLQTFNCIMASNQTESLKKKRTRGATQVQDLASLNGIALCNRHPECYSSQSPVAYDMREVGNSDRPHTSIEALMTEMQAKLAKKKRSKKRNCLVNSACSSTSEAQLHKRLVLSNQNQFSPKLLGTPPEVIWKQMVSPDALVEQFNQLDINREGNPIAYEEQNALVPYNMRYQEHNAVVLYGDGTIVPFGPTKKRRPRPKVDLDEETNRVWKLLLENINSEGIDGTDEETAKWWEEERRVFHGRADSFIARMHLVQGDRRFSPWKGSVVDSVIGVFLTQNVSDHLSSSAFMSLAAYFPLKSMSKEKIYHQAGTSLANGAEFYVLEPEDTIKWDTNTSIQPVGDQSSMTVNGYGYSEEKEVVNSKELSGSSTAIVSSTNESKCKLLNSCGSGLGTYCNSTLNRLNMETLGNGTECFKGDEETNDVLSSQNSVVSSENSVDFSLVQNAERTGSCSECNSEGGDQTKGPIFDVMNSSTSFVQLLRMAGSARLHEVYGHQNISTNENSKVKRSQFQNDQRGNCDNSGPKSFTIEDIIPSANYHLHLTLNSEVREIEHFEMFKEETRSSKASKMKDENMIKGQSPLTEESACQTIDQNDSTMCVLVALQSSSENNHSSNNIQQDETTVPHCQMRLLQDPRNLVESPADTQNKEMLRHVDMTKHLEEILDITESTTAFDNQRSPQQKMQESNLFTHDSSSNKGLNQMNAGSLKSKGKKANKEKKDDFDWDSLRKQAEANGIKRERTEKTMDSLDWEAVRCADVNEIAKTIKERGMNNMLAGRIKDFLNRLVRDHGSIDLEWLRDVPPDKAKEYLLSIRGLGLKSVECVRLLTLHHLAFPVDTNVGRIVVRLGWVPLQPLPESLQLHLLELYPILESIQKYLWPRLCKLDQRTLYELHYQMITFGKVFCTKSKPNCNACPMRGECRHFASAFASARLALPGPEEKSIVSATDNSKSDQNHAVIIDQLALPLPQPTEQSDINWQSEANQQSQAKYGGNNPIIEEPASPEPVCTQVAENDIEDIFYEDPDEIPMIKLNMEEFTQNLQNYMQNNMELQEGNMSKALVALTAEAASIPTPKLKNVSRLRTEHQVYELPDSHPLLRELDKREPDDPSKYLLAIWTPGETANSIQLPERSCNSQEHGKLCDEKTCFSCNSIREAECQIVRGTLLIPCRTAMRGSFPLNGTYFQVNEVFADHDSSLNPIDVPREWLWNLPRRMVYFGTSIPSIFKGLTTEGIQHCFWRGFVCVRGFDQKSRAPRPLMARLHFPASKLTRGKGKGAGEDE